MKAFDLLQAMNGAGDRDILDAQIPVKKKKAAKILLIAAAAAAAAALVGCTAVYLLHVKDLQIGEKTQVIPQWGGQVIEQPTEEGGNRKVTMVEGEYQGVKEVTQQVFSFSGLRGSPEYEAAQEWFQFMERFDPDHRKATAYYQKRDAAQKEDPGFTDYFPEEYWHYAVYDQAMADKVDEILKKYELKGITDWRSQWYEFQEPGQERISRFTGVDHFFRPDGEVSIHAMSSSGITKENRFCMGCTLSLPWEGIPAGWDGEPYTPLFTVEFIPRGYFEPQVFRLDMDEKFQEENYTTQAGDQVLILQALEGFNSFLFCQRSDGMFALKVESRLDLYYEDENGVDHADCTYLTMDQLKRIADDFDFSLELNPDWEYVEQENQNYEETTRRLIAEQEAREATAPEDDARDG